MIKIKKIIDKKNKSKIICLTAYSKNFASEIDKHADIVLVGDSLGEVIKGAKNTHSVTVDEICSDREKEIVKRYTEWFLSHQSFDEDVELDFYRNAINVSCLIHVKIGYFNDDALAWIDAQDLS
mgnify:CR=1 FL=1